MNMHCRILLVGLSVVTISGVAGAEGTNLFECVDREFIFQKCVLRQADIASPVMDHDEPFETDYAVTYDFPCRGSAVNIGVRSGTDFQAFRLGAVGETVVSRGTGPLATFDPDPHRTARLGFRPGCRLVIREVTALPSANAIAFWTAEARAQARIVEISLDLYRLSKSFAEIATFNDAQLGVVIEATQARMDAASTAIDKRRWRSLFDSLVAMREAQPLPVPKAEVDASLNDLAEDARASLLREVDTARAMIARFETWSLVVESTLKDVLARLPAI